MLQYQIHGIGNDGCVRHSRLFQGSRSGLVVYCEGIAIGKVIDVKFVTEEKALVKVSIDKSLRPSKQDSFALVNFGYFGSQAVEIIRGNENGSGYRDRDTIAGIVLNKQPRLGLDSAAIRMAIDSLLPPIKK